MAARKNPVRKTRPRRRRDNASYLALMSEFPIYPIRSEQDLDEAIATLDNLLGRPKLDRAEQDYLEVLSHEIERFESESIPMPRVSASQVLRHLIESRDATYSRVAADTDIPVSTLSEIVAGKRNLNLTHIKKLAPYFGVPAAVFLD